MRRALFPRATAEGQGESERESNFRRARSFGIRPMPMRALARAREWNRKGPSSQRDLYFEFARHRRLAEERSVEWGTQRFLGQRENTQICRDYIFMKYIQRMDLTIGCTTYIFHQLIHNGGPMFYILYVEDENVIWEIFFHFVPFFLSFTLCFIQIAEKPSTLH